MSKRKLHISDKYSAPVEFVTQTLAILAKKGSGKSHAAQLHAEQLLELGQQIVAIDPVGSWWGLRSSADGKEPGFSVTIFGGEHGDVPLEPTAGETLATAIATEHFSCVIDLSLMRKAERLRFCVDFLETLYRVNREALHLFIDEADTVAPQKPFDPIQARCLGAADELVRRGRQRGLGCTLISQRPQVVNKDVLSQVDQLLVLRMNHPKDLRAIEDWISDHVDAKRAKEMISSLPSLAIGEGWVWAPDLHIFERIKINPKRTFDSGRTPKPGERVRAPKKLARVDLDRLGAAMAATVEQAKANDPKALKATIAELRAELEKARGSKVKTVTVTKEIISERALVRLEKAFAPLADLPRLLEVQADRAVSAGSDVRALLRAVVGEDAEAVREVLRDRKIDRMGLKPAAGATPPKVAPAPARTTKDYVQNGPTPAGRWQPSRAVPKSAPNSPAPRDGSADRDISGPGRVHLAMLAALAEHPEGLARKKLRIHSGYSDSGPTSKAMKLLTDQGWAELDSDVGLLRITALGREVLGPYTPPPKGDALRAVVLEKLDRAERRMMEVLCEAYPGKLKRPELRERAGYSDSGPTSKAIKHIIGTDYVVDHGREGISATPELFG